MASILGFDPGETTGVAHVLHGEVKAFAMLKGKEGLYTFLRETMPTMSIDFVVVEDYIQRPDNMVRGKSHNQWTPQATAKYIGAITYAAELLGIRVVEQQPSIKPQGYKFAKLEYKPGKKGTHAFDAIAHAMYLERVGIR